MKKMIVVLFCLCCFNRTEATTCLVKEVFREGCNYTYIVVCDKKDHLVNAYLPSHPLTKGMSVQIFKESPNSITFLNPKTNELTTCKKE